jgi:hypothetical protein
MSVSAALAGQVYFINEHQEEARRLTAQLGYH